MWNQNFWRLFFLFFSFSFFRNDALDSDVSSIMLLYCMQMSRQCGIRVFLFFSFFLFFRNDALDSDVSSEIQMRLSFLLCVCVCVCEEDFFFLLPSSFFFENKKKQTNQKCEGFFCAYGTVVGLADAAGQDGHLAGLGAANNQKKIHRRFNNSNNSNNDNDNNNNKQETCNGHLIENHWVQRSHLRITKR